MIKKKPKIVFITSSPFTINAFMKNHIMNLIKSYEVVLIVNKGLGILNDNLLNKIRIINIDLRREINIFYDLLNIIKVYIHLKKEKPDILFSLTSKTGLFSATLGYITKIQYRIHIFTGLIWYNKIFFSRFFFKLIDKIICKFSTHILVDSFGQIKLLKTEITKDKTINVLGNGSVSGVDTKKFKPLKNLYINERIKLDKKDLFIYLYVGRVIKEKGIIDLIEISKELSSKLINIEFWIVGPDEENIMKNFSSNENYKTIKYFGQSETPEIFMAKSDVLVLPSHREGFGNVIIEAASCGLPTIAYDIVGPREIIKNNVTGFLVKENSRKSFKNKMMYVYINKNKLSKIGFNAKKHVSELYNKKLVEKSWINYFDNFKIKIDKNL